MNIDLGEYEPTTYPLSKRASNVASGFYETLVRTVRKTRNASMLPIVAPPFPVRPPRACPSAQAPHCASVPPPPPLAGENPKKSYFLPPRSLSRSLSAHMSCRTALVRAFFACVRARERSGHAWGVGISRIHEGRSNGRHAMQEGAVTFLAPPTSSLPERAERATRYFEGAVGSEISPRAQ